jgi:hypothetical protein
MNQQIPQIEPKKGLSKGCTIALIIGGIVLVVLAGTIILIMTKGEKWAYKMAANTERTLIMAKPIDGIDTVAVNRVADQFLKNLEVGEVDSERMIPFGSFVTQFATDTKVDSAEAVAYVQAMIDCYPELSELYQPLQVIDTSAVIDTTVTGK